MTTTMNIAGVAAQSPVSPAFRIRLLLPAKVLRRQGIELKALPLLTSDEAVDLRRGSVGRRARTVLDARKRLRRELEALPDSSAIVVQRQVDLLPGLALERLARRTGRLVLDVDDAIWLDASRDAGGQALARLKRTAQKVKWLASHADVVVAGNEHLAGWLSEHASTVTVIPSLVDPGAFGLRRHEPAGRVTIGWLGSQTTARYLDRMSVALRRAAEALPDTALQFVVMGAKPPAVAGVEMRSIPWHQDREREFLQALDIGVMPQPDNPWTRGKCAYKAIQYMAAGVPVVADRVGTAEHVVGDGGIVVAGDGEWTAALVTLASDAGLRARLGAAGRRRIERHYSLDAWAGQVARAFAGV